MTANLLALATVMLACFGAFVAIELALSARIMPGAGVAREALRKKLGEVAAARVAAGAGVPVAVTPVTTGAERQGARILLAENMEGGIVASGAYLVDLGRECVVARPRGDRWVTTRRQERRA